MQTQLTYSQAVKAMYLGHSSASLEMFRNTSDAAFQILETSSYSAKIIISAVTGLESYLRARLGRTLFSSGSNEIDHYIYEYLHDYIDAYNDDHFPWWRRHPEKKHLPQIPEGGHLTEEQKKALGDSVKKLNFHKTKDLDKKYFSIFKISINVDGLFDEVNKLIDLRNDLAHNGGMPAEMRINREINISTASRAIDVIGDYIVAVEARFLNRGFVPVLDEIELAGMGIDDIDLLEKKNQE